VTDMGSRMGRCLCGAVRYVASAMPDHLSACHCGNCRRISGSATISVAVPYRSMRIEGVENVGVYTSSDWATRSFCKLCGSGLWYRSIGDDAAYVISAGTLDDLTGMMLTQEIYVDCKPHGYAFAGDHPRLTRAEFEATWNENVEERLT
jgi:hypothetical protein